MGTMETTAKKKLLNPCACGCGGLTPRVWVQGHHKRRFSDRLQMHRLGVIYGPSTGNKFGPIYGPGHFAKLGQKVKRRHRQGPSKAGATMKAKALLKRLLEEAP